MSEAAASPQLAARRANLEKAQAVPKQVRYRMTEKRLAACWRNLEKARAVAPEIRFRRTEKRLEANRANLRKAREHARVTGATLRHGMSCRTLEESLAGAVGEAQAGPGAAGVCEEKTDCSAGVLTGGLRPEHDPSPALLRRAPSPQGRGL